MSDLKAICRNEILMRKKQLQQSLEKDQLDMNGMPGFPKPFARGHVNIRYMKKIDILNYITNFRKEPNDIKTYQELLVHLGSEKSSILDQMLVELQQSRVIRETSLNGERAYQVISR